MRWTGWQMVLNAILSQPGEGRPIWDADVYVRDDKAYLPLRVRMLFGGDLRLVGLRECPLTPDALAGALEGVVRFGHPRVLLALGERELRWDPVYEAIGGPWGQMARAGWVRYTISRTPSATQVYVQADTLLAWGAATEDLADKADGDNGRGGGPRRLPPNAPLVAVAGYIVTDVKEHQEVNFRVLPPWIEYPGTYPAWGGWRQGYSEAWIHDVWFPFWRQLSREERDAYLQRWPPPEDWVDWVLHYSA